MCCTDDVIGRYVLLDGGNNIRCPVSRRIFENTIFYLEFVHLVGRSHSGFVLESVEVSLRKLVDETFVFEFFID